MLNLCELCPTESEHVGNKDCKEQLKQTILAEPRVNPIPVSTYPEYGTDPPQWLRDLRSSLIAG